MLFSSLKNSEVETRKGPRHAGFPMMSSIVCAILMATVDGGRGFVSGVALLSCFTVVSFVSNFLAANFMMAAIIVHLLSGDGLANFLHFLVLYFKKTFSWVISTSVWIRHVCPSILLQAVSMCIALVPGPVIELYPVVTRRMAGLEVWWASATTAKVSMRAYVRTRPA